MRPRIHALHIAPLPLLRARMMPTLRMFLTMPTTLPMLAMLMLLAMLTTTACYATPKEAATPLVRAQAAHDLDCPDEDIRIEQELTGYFKAIGCGRKAYYSAACQGLQCVVSDRENGQVIPWRDRPAPDEMHR